MMKFLLYIIFLLSCRTEAPSKSAAQPVSEVVETRSDSGGANPSTDTLDYDQSKWVELTKADGYFIDLKYATPDNFVKEVIYPCGRCFVKPAVAKALANVRDDLMNQGYRLKLFDCYRPQPAQEKLWKKVPNPNYVAPPSEGSMHSRGVALDLTLTERTGKEIDMGTPYDFFGKEAHHDYTQLSDKVLGHRKLLKKTMETHGFQSIRTEWWHYSLDNSMPPLEKWQWKCE